MTWLIVFVLTLCVFWYLYGHEPASYGRVLVKVLLGPAAVATAITLLLWLAQKALDTPFAGP